MPVLDLLDVAPATLDDHGLLAAAASLADARRRIDAKQAEVAAELAHRSRREHARSASRSASGRSHPTGCSNGSPGSTRARRRPSSASGSC